MPDDSAPVVAEADGSRDGSADAVHTGSRDSTFVQSLERGLAVIRAFDAEHPRLTLSEVARSTGMTRAAARRFLLTLVALGYVRHDGREFSLRPRVLELGYAYLSGQTLPELVVPHLETLVGKVNESSSVSVLDGDDVVYIARVPTKRIMTVAIGLGSRFPAFQTSMGRVLLADLPDATVADVFARSRRDHVTDRTVATVEALLRELAIVREQGWALVDQELEVGVRSVAAPITKGGAGRPLAAMNVSTHAGRTTLDEVREVFVPALVHTARSISEALARR